MGSVISSIVNMFSTKQPYSICMIGLDAAGKTTILYQMQLGNTITTIPTIGFNVEKFQVGNVVFNCWDIGGQDKIRPVWSRYVEVSDGIVFVVDIYDEERWSEAGEALQNVLETNGSKPILILANKADDPEDPDLENRKERMLKDFEIENLSNFWECRTVSGIVSVTDNNPLIRLVPAFQWMVDSLEKSSSLKGKSEL